MDVYYIPLSNVDILTQSMWPSDTIWRHKLGQYRLTVPSHYLNLCWLITGEVLCIHMRAISKPLFPMSKSTYSEWVVDIILPVGTLQWRHIDRDGVSNQRRLECSLNRSGADRRKHQSSVLPAFVWESTGDRRIPLKKGKQRGKCFLLMTSSCNSAWFIWFSSPVSLFYATLIQTQIMRFIAGKFVWQHRKMLCYTKTVL